MFKQSLFYHLVNLYGNTYLLPFGQKMADQAPAFQLNGTGVWIWKHLEEAESVKELVHSYIRENGSVKQSEKELEDDFASYLQQMRENGLITGDPVQVSEPVFCTISIAGLSIELRGFSSFFSEDFLAFKVPVREGAAADQVITVTTKFAPALPGARVILENEELCVLDAGNEWELLYPSSPVIAKTLVTKDGRRADIFIKDPYSENPVQDVFHAIRLPFLLFAREHGFYALHSASVNYNGKALLFSAPSGTGKSTHAALWEKAGWAKILNGDLNLIGFHDGRPYVYGIPWCGTSGRFTTETVPLGSVFLLKRGKKNRIEQFSMGQRLLKASQRLISPIWTRDMLDSNLAFCRRLAERIPVCGLSCTPDIAAAVTVREYIDS